MAEEDDSEKTEEPSSRKLNKAQEKGQTAQSQELKSWAILLGGAIGLLFLAPFMMHGVMMTSLRFVEQPHRIPTDFEHLRLVVSQLMLELSVYIWPLMLILLVLAIGISVVQSGLVFTTERMKPTMDKIGLISGFKKRFSMTAVIEFLKGIGKLAIVTATAVFLVVPLLGDLAVVPDYSLRATLDKLHLIALWLVAATMAVMTVIAAIDYVWQKHTFIQKMKMTKQEVKDEYKQVEGDPQVKARIRKIRAERSRQRMMAAVPEADVVVTNPTHFAVALQYTMGAMSAPKLVAKGVDTLALKIREVAEENDVPVVENPPLARALYAAVEIDEEIPEEHYRAVAEVIGYVMRLKGKLPPEQGQTPPIR